MYKIINIILFLLISLFFFTIFKYYSSNMNINNKNYNRLNIDQILKDKITNLPILENDTENVIKFNNKLNELDNNEKRSFWDLIKN